MRLCNIAMLVLVFFGTCAFARQSNDASREKWFGTRCQQLLKLPGGNEGFGELEVSLKLANQLSPEQTDARAALVNRVSDAVHAGVNADQVSFLLSYQPINSGRGTGSNFGPPRPRRLFYEAMIARAESLRSQDPEGSKRLAKAVTLLFLLDYPQFPRNNWWDKATTFGGKEGLLGFDENESEAWLEFAQESRDQYMPGIRAIIALAKASIPLYDATDTIDHAQLQTVLGHANTGWKLADAEFGHRRSIAVELWQLRRLAKSVNDAQAMRQIEDAINELKQLSIDRLSTQWASEVLTLDGPRPKRPSIRVAKPEDYRPATPPG